jgi:hypothetical protein
MKCLTAIFILFTIVGVNAQRTVAIRCARHGVIEGNYQSCPRCAAEAAPAGGQTGGAMQSGAYNFGYGLGAWLMSGPSEEELRQAELKRLENEREAQRIAAEQARMKEQQNLEMSARLNSTLKLSGRANSPQLANSQGGDSMNRLGLKLGRPQTRKNSSAVGSTIQTLGVKVETPNEASPSASAPSDLDGGFQSRGTGTPLLGDRGNGGGAPTSTLSSRPQSNGSDQKATNQASAATTQGGATFDGVGAKGQGSDLVFHKTTDSVYAPLDLDHVPTKVAADPKFQKQKRDRDLHLAKEVAAQADIAKLKDAQKTSSPAEKKVLDLQMEIATNEANREQNARRQIEAIIKIGFPIDVREE